MMFELDIPFDNLDDYFQAAYVIVNFKEYTDETLIIVINHLTSKKITKSDIRFLKYRIITSPSLYGLSFLSQKEELKCKINLLIEKRNVIVFESKVNRCIFCLSSCFKGI